MRYKVSAYAVPLFALAVLFIGLTFVLDFYPQNAPKDAVYVSTTSEVALVETLSNESSKPDSAPTKTTALTAQKIQKTPTPAPVKKVPVERNSAPVVETASTTQVTRIESPYELAPLPFETLESATRGATVNILCMPKSGTLHPTSGSGVMIDPRGIILTNAHVAQYVLLSQDPRVDLSCVVRTGSPAAPHWIAEVLYLPPAWIHDHYTDIRADRPTGTGEHDYALLRVVSDTNGAVPTQPIPYLPIDSRENVAFLNDTVLVGGYPAEFVGGLAAQRGLYAVTSIATIQKLLTFDTGTVDLFSVGGIIGAQGGSSGGPAVNAWGHVVGIVTTTSEGATTADRDLHVNTLSYIDKDIKLQSGKSLREILTTDTKSESDDFAQNIAPSLLAFYFTILVR